MPDEVWLPVLGSPGYDVSDAGRIKGPRGILKPSRLNSGYLGVKVGGKGTTVHAVVTLAFIGQRPTPAHTVNHKNGDKHDNRPANLEWLTQAENNRHAVEVLGRQSGRPCKPKSTDDRDVIPLDLRKHGGKNWQIEPRLGYTSCRLRCLETGEVAMAGTLKQVFRFLARQQPHRLGARNLN